MDSDNEMGQAFLTDSEKHSLSNSTTYTVTLSNTTIFAIKVLLFIILLSSLVTTGLCIAGAIIASGYLSGEYTIDSVSLIPSVSSLLEAGTNSVHLTSALTSGAAIFNALSTISWEVPPPKSCLTYYGCQDEDLKSCYDFNDTASCEAVVADDGVFHPNEHCEWGYSDDDGSSTEYCQGNPEICTSTQRISDLACWDPEPISSQDSADLNNAFQQTAIRLTNAIVHNRDTSREDTPSSSFDFVKYVADELGKDWGEIAQKFASTLGDLADCDWEDIFTTFAGPLRASEMAAEAEVMIRGYKGWVEIVAEPLKKIQH